MAGHSAWWPSIDRADARSRGTGADADAREPVQRGLSGGDAAADASGGRGDAGRGENCGSGGAVKLWTTTLELYGRVEINVHILLFGYITITLACIFVYMSLWNEKKLRRPCSVFPSHMD